MKSTWKYCMAVIVTITGIASAGVIVPSLDDGTTLAQYNAARNGNLGDTSADITNGQLTLAARFNPDVSQATAGPVILIEVGGTSNGTGLYLVNGNLVFCSKAGNGRYSLPTSLSDTDFINDGTGKAMAVDLGAVRFGAENKVYVSMDLINGLLFAGINGTTNSYAITNTNGNGSENLDGNRTVSFLGLDGFDPGHMGGLVEEGIGNNASTLYPQLFWTNTLPMIQTDGYDNQLGQVFNTYVPEPATLALLALGGLALRRRK